MKQNKVQVIDRLIPLLPVASTSGSSFAQSLLLVPLLLPSTTSYGLMTV
jgi:hypothetical protein